MKTSKKNKYLKFLFWLGLFLFIMGISSMLVAGSWSPVSLGLLLAGMVILGLCLVFLGSVYPGFWGGRPLEVGTNAIIATVAMLMILGLINFLAVRYAERIDLTETKLFTISPLSQRLVKKLQQPLKVWVFEPNPNPSDKDLLKNYRRYGPLFQFEFVDAQLQPSLAQKFNIKSPRGEVYVEYEPERKFVQNVSDAERLSETKVTNAIESLTSVRTDKIYFLQGHGERPLQEVEEGFSEAINALKDKKFISQTLNLSERSAIPEDASLVVIAGPKRKLFDGEVQALKNYLSNGGSLLVMIDPEFNPGLDNLLADWGVKLPNQVVIDASGRGSSINLGFATPVVRNYGNHPITADFGDGYSFYPIARPVEINPVEGVQQTPLLKTNEQSWGESHVEKQPLQFDPKEDRPGPLILGVALSRNSKSSSELSTPKPKSQTTPEVSPTPINKSLASPGVSPTPKAVVKSSPEISPTPKPQVKSSPEISPTPKVQAKSSPEVSPIPKPQVKSSPEVSPTPKVQAKSSPEVSPTPLTKAPSNADNSVVNKDQKAESRLVVFGNSTFATNVLFKQQLNGDVLLNSIGWLSKRDEQTFSIRPKEQQTRRISLAPMQLTVLAWTFLLVPFFGFTTAGVLWWKRR
jgi:ABC-type uncharacterized transport system involved in gliding motility auxiliary subunit